MSDLEILRQILVKLSDMEQGINEIKQDVSELKQDVAELKQDVAELKQDVVELKQDVVELKRDMVEVKSEIKAIKTQQNMDINTLELVLAEIGKIHEVLSVHDREIKELKAAI